MQAAGECTCDNFIIQRAIPAPGHSAIHEVRIDENVVDPRSVIRLSSCSQRVPALCCRFGESSTLHQLDVWTRTTHAMQDNIKQKPALTVYALASWGWKYRNESTSCPARWSCVVSVTMSFTPHRMESIHFRHGWSENSTPPHGTGSQ